MTRDKSREETLLDKIDGLRAEIERQKASAEYWRGEAVRAADTLPPLRAEVESLQASLKMTNGGERELSAFLKLEAEVGRLKAAIAWTLEVHPGKTREGCAVVEMTWDQFNTLRALAALEDKP